MTEPIDQIIKYLDLGHNIFITGGAGTGKSWNMRKVIEWAESKNLEIARTALTGMASLQFDCGETLHRCFGIGFNKNVKQLSYVTRSYKFANDTRWELEALDIIIIDEVSMLRSDTIELCNVVLQYVMQNKKPFGGKQVIFSGDFMQLPPVVKPEERKEVPKPWAFQSSIWTELDLKIIYLKEIKRQDDHKFCLALNMLRAGAINDSVDEYFFNTYLNEFPENIEPVRLLSTNREVELVNDKKLKTLNTDLESYKAKISGKDEKLIDRIKRDCPAMETLDIKEGAQVMILINDKSYRYVNGSMGEFIGITEMSVGMGLFEEIVKAVLIRLFDSDETVCIPINEWKIEKKEDDKVEVLARFKQFPIKLGWAITIHKSQGMTIDYLQVDLTRCFAEGMAYVALSRARTYEGLKIINWRRGAVRCNKDAFDFYMNLKNKGEI